MMVGCVEENGPADLTHVGGTLDLMGGGDCAHQGRENQPGQCGESHAGNQYLGERERSSIPPDRHKIGTCRRGSSSPESVNEGQGSPWKPVDAVAE